MCLQEAVYNILWCWEAGSKCLRYKHENLSSEPQNLRESPAMTTQIPQIWEICGMETGRSVDFSGQPAQLSWGILGSEKPHIKNQRRRTTKGELVVNTGLHKCTHKYMCLHSNTNTFVHPHSYPLCAWKRAKGGSNLPLISWHRQTSLHKISGKRKTRSVFNGTRSKHFLHDFLPSGNELASASGKHMAKIRSSMASKHGQVLSCNPMWQSTHSSKWQFNFQMKPSLF